MITWHDDEEIGVGSRFKLEFDFAVDDGPSPRFNDPHKRYLQVLFRDLDLEVSVTRVLPDLDAFTAFVSFPNAGKVRFKVNASNGCVEGLLSDASAIAHEAVIEGERGHVVPTSLPELAFKNLNMEPLDAGKTVWRRTKQFEVPVYVARVVDEDGRLRDYATFFIERYLLLDEPRAASHDVGTVERIVESCMGEMLAMRFFVFVDQERIAFDDSDVVVLTSSRGVFDVFPMTARSRS